MLKQYEEPELEVIRFTSEDVITASNTETGWLDTNSIGGKTIS